MENKLDKEEIKELLSKGWIQVRFTVEVMANSKENAEKNIKEHMEKLKKVSDFKVYKEDYEKAEKVKKLPPRFKNKVKEAWSQMVESEMMVSDYNALVRFSFAFGPSSVEILEPEKIELSQDQMQNIINTLAGLIHQYTAARGIGGLVIAPR